MTVDHGKVVFDIKIYSDNWTVLSYKEKTHEGFLDAMKGMVLAMTMLFMGAVGEKKRQRVKA